MPALNAGRFGFPGPESQCHSCVSEDMLGRVRNDIRRLRGLQAPELSQKELARLVGVRQSRVSAWEQGHAAPSLHYILRLAHALCAPVETLFAQLDAEAADWVAQSREQAR